MSYKRREDRIRGDDGLGLDDVEPKICRCGGGTSRRGTGSESCTVQFRRIRSALRNTFLGSFPPKTEAPRRQLLVLRRPQMWPDRPVREEAESSAWLRLRMAMSMKGARSTG